MIEYASLLFGWLSDTSITFSFQLLLVILLRRPVIHFFGAQTSYLLWLLPALWIIVPNFRLRIDASILVTFRQAMKSTLEIAPTRPVVRELMTLDWSFYMVLIWTLGITLLSVIYIFQYVKFNRNLNRVHEIKRKFNIKRLCEQLKIKDKIQIQIVDVVIVPQFGGS